MNNTNRSQLTEEELAALAEQHRAIANGALLRARAARNAALMAAAGSPGLLPPAGLPGDPFSNSWLSSLQQHPRQQLSAMQAAAGVPSPSVGVPATSQNVNAIALRPSGGGEELNTKGSIPIGFFRDPRGNAWAASLQHPNRQGNAQANLLGGLRDQQESALVALQAAQLVQNSMVNLPNNKIAQEVIEIEDSEEEEEVQAPRPAKKAKSSAAPQPAKVTGTAEKKAGPNSSKPTKPKEDSVPQTNEKISQSGRGPGTSIKAGKSAVPDPFNLTPLSHNFSPRNSPQKKSTEAISHNSRKSTSTPQPPIKSIVGPFTQKWMMLQVPAVDRNREMRECMGKIIDVATGMTEETSPADLPFPPGEVVLDVEKLSGLATELIEERHQAIGTAIRQAYMEMKSRHEQIVTMRQDDNSKVNQEVQSGIEKKIDLKWAAKIQTMNNSHKDEIKKAKKKHEDSTNKLMQNIRDLKKELKAAKERLDIAQDSQGKAIDTIMKASVMSLRMMQKKRKYEQ